ncbi:SusC/RagA family TonB-linked outer membrane protein [Wenyingzhuangia sp. IMCC45467]
MKHNIKNLLYCFSFILISITSNNLFAQQGTMLVRGTVIDSKTNEPVLGATVTEQDADSRIVTAVITDFDGNFAIRFKKASNRLVVSTIGYATQTLNVTANKNIIVSLVSKTEDLDEVVLTAKKTPESGLLNIAERDLTTSVVTINAKEVENVQGASIAEQLQGRVPGMDITASSGDPGAGMQIRIRGTSSINGSSEPLIVVDGMPLETSVPEGFNFSTADQQGYAAMLNIAPSDIETISILKDAAATAMWGARAASGVLIINTKRGAIGKPRFQYSFRGTLQSLPEQIPMLNGDQYSQLIPEAYMNRSGVPLNTLTVKEFQYDPQEVYWYKNYSNNTDWVDAITQTAFTQDHNITMNGGGDKAKYYASVGFYDSNGVTKGTNYTRLNGRLNLDYTVSDRIRFRADLSYTTAKNDRNYTDGDRDRDLIRGVAQKKMPNMAIYEYDEQGNLTPNLFSPESNIQGSYPGTYNPLAMIEFAQNTQEDNRIIPKFRLDADLVPGWLKTIFDLQFDFNSIKRKRFLPQNASGRPFTESIVNLVDESSSDGLGIQTKTNFVFTPKMNSDIHTLSAVASFQTNQYQGEGYRATTSNSASVLLRDPSIPSRTNTGVIGSGSNSHRSVAAVFSAQYGLLDRYLLNAGVRTDGDSKFGPGQRFATFPSLSARWRISGEPFMKGLKFVDDLSLRASIGQSGGSPDNKYGSYIYQNQYNTFGSTYLGENGVYSGNVQLDDLQWETLTGKNIGFNTRLFDYRFSLDVEFYQNRTENLLFPNLSIPSSSGYSALGMKNTGTMDNRGFEIGLQSTPYKSDKWQVDFNFNIARNENVVRELSEYLVTEAGSAEQNGSYKRYVKENNPFGSFYGYKFKGVYKDLESTKARDAQGNVITGPNGQDVYMRFNYPNTDYTFQPGDAMYEDINNDGNIDSKDVVYLGNSNPMFTGGFGSTVKYNRNLSLMVFFTYRLDYDVINETDMYTTNMYGFDNQSTAVLSRWRNPGDETDMPRAVYRGGFNWLGSDRYVEDASFLRFRSASLRYTFDKKVLKGLKMDDLSMFFTVDNIYTFTKYSGQNPDTQMKGGDMFGIAVDKSRTPVPRKFTVGISARF